MVCVKVVGRWLSQGCRCCCSALGAVLPNLATSEVATVKWTTCVVGGEGGEMLGSVVVGSA